ncbi:nitrate ABC transporter substrate-binding protein [Prauserella marina]|uniref:ABC-type nitrate/sulfonate/bicarbonate transport system, substrate-binding protein n=1 Tax=Prauserella marina TaxID=530584 RepID=A0A222VPN8_9PSEU|nr:ABC transporter substrate-binding protein [Prauserella marina]ASR35870.1 nitrate ABC transporter substrate-binding protein [Prauserella marina]PWV84212.1 ABC-type nitrate/sulfonate/bicarbonate transport system substrate-binding protein [Prauserella marina]SDC27921.1 ABC-type nitrate/sulfonate/bicarbonate transport system, substrate-binding protein [Prauserella marina]
MAERIARRSVLKGLVAAPLLGTALAGCATRHSTTPAGTLNIGQISDSVAFLPLYIAETKGFFTEEGLTLGERPRLGTGAKVAAALKSGSIDLGAGVITDAFNLARIDDGTKIVSSLVTEYYVDVIVAADFEGPGDDATMEDKVAALVGKRIGITGPGSGTEGLVNYLFNAIGRNAAIDSTLVNLGSAATAAIGALKSDRVDALAFFQPIGQQAEATGTGRIYLSPARGDIPSMRGALHGVMFSTSKLLERKRDEVAGFNRAIARALDVIHGDPAHARELLGKYLDKSNPEALDALLPILRAEIPASPEVGRQAYETATKFHLDSGLIDKAPGYGSVILA